jgi:competence protein ComEA
MWEAVKMRWKMGALMLFAVAAGVWVFSRSPAEQVPMVLAPAAEETDAGEPEVKTSAPPSTVMVDIKGAVKKPGVYEAPADARVRDVIALAGGLTAEADDARVNLAAKVHDEMMIYVPKKGEAAPALEAAGAMPKAEGGRPQVAINTAAVEEIMQLPGIGRTKAEAIIAYREEHGPFQRAEELLNVTGIGEKTLEKLRPYLIIP